MPLVARSSYLPPFWLRGGHAQTIFPAVFRRMPWITRTRERLELADGDFLDLDWAAVAPVDRVAIVSHGLEGESRDTYVQGMAAALVRAGWNVVAWNCRGCSGEANRLLRSYHSGATEDLAAVVERVLRESRYRRVALVGFSLGGNITLKYLGDLGEAIDSRLDRAVGFLGALRPGLELADAGEPGETASTWTGSWSTSAPRSVRKCGCFPGGSGTRDWMPCERSGNSMGPTRRRCMAIATRRITGRAPAASRCSAASRFRRCS